MTRRWAQRVWALYDWASTPFSITVSAVFLGPYLTDVAKAAADGNGYVHPFGFAISAGSFFPYVISFSVLLQVIFLPAIGALSDAWHHERLQFIVYGYAGALATMSLFFVQGSNYLLGGALTVLANLTYGSAFLLYDSFLNAVALPDERHVVSTRGWAAGILGGGVLLTLNVALVDRASSLALSSADAIRLSLGSAGVWWALFAIIPAIWLRLVRPAAAATDAAEPRERGRKRMIDAYRALARHPHTLRFLVAYLLYNDGVQTATGQAALFGQEELGISIGTIAVVILMVQFVAAGSAFGFHWLAGRIGAKPAVLGSLVLWTASIIYAYGWLHSTAQYVGLGVAFAVALGGSQALSRSLFSLLVLPGWEANFFGVFMISSRGTSWLGPLCFGLAYQFSHSYRVALVSIVIFFASGMLLLLRVDVEKGALEASALGGGELVAQESGYV